MLFFCQELLEAKIRKSGVHPVYKIVGQKPEHVGYPRVNAQRAALDLDKTDFWVLSVFAV